MLNHGTVLFDEGKFRMWYGGGASPARRLLVEMDEHRLCPKPATASLGKSPVSTAAESSPELDCNQLPLPWPCAVFKDAEDRKPAGRYKVVQFDRHQLQLMAALAGEYDMEAPTCPGGLHQSADGTALDKRADLDFLSRRQAVGIGGAELLHRPP